MSERACILLQRRQQPVDIILGDARRGARFLGAVSSLLCAFGIAGEIASILG